MSSIRAKVTLLTVCAIIVSLSTATILGVSAVQNIGNRSSRQILTLLCETGEKNLEYYFENAERAVEVVSEFASADLKGLESRELEEHIERVSDTFKNALYRTNGALTYYYRIDPSVSDTVEGFWYTNLDGKGFERHKVTDITQYDTEDTSKLVWFTVPKATGRAVWLPVYVTENLDIRVISYNAPIYQDSRFIGVIGVEIDFSTMTDQVDSISLYDNGYAFVNDEDGKLIYHPRFHMAELDAKDKPEQPEGVIAEDTFFHYSFQGIEKLAVACPLSNGMRLTVCVPVSEINGSWHRLAGLILGLSVALLVLFVLLAMRISGQIVKPLGELTEAAAQVNEGNYDFVLEYKGNDEVGILTRAFSDLTRHLKVYVNYLNDMAYQDKLTSLRNKGAFDTFIRELQIRLLETDETIEYGIVILRCDGWEAVQNQYGAEKGNLLLKKASQVICHVFKHSPVFRTGTNEFSVVLEKNDYQMRDELISTLRQQAAGSCASEAEPWDQLHLMMGISIYDPETDHYVNDVVRRAEKLSETEKPEM